MTVKQLNELSKKGLLGYKKYLIDKHSCRMKSIFKGEVEPMDLTGFKAEQLSLLSIGQMIEFLDENTKYPFHIFRRLVDWKINYNNLSYGKILGGELCDSLWQLVKDVLDNDN